MAEKRHPPSPCNGYSGSREEGKHLNLIVLLVKSLAVVLVTFNMSVLAEGKVLHVLLLLRRSRVRNMIRLMEQSMGRKGRLKEISEAEQQAKRAEL